MERPIVYLVDDEPMVLELARLILPSQTYDVRTFRDPQQALDAYLLAEPKPKVIVTDFAMKEMTGIELIKACRKNRPDQKAVLMSGTVSSDVCIDIKPGPNAFLLKPFQIAEFEELVRGLAL